MLSKVLTTNFHRGILWYAVIFGVIGCSSSAIYNANHYLNYVTSKIMLSYNFIKDHTYCAYEECCTDVHIKADIDQLETALDKYLFGQHIAKKAVVDAVGGHFHNIHTSEKPLVISLHGSPGTGKNFVAEHIVQALYKNGANSKYVHKYRGRIDFPLQSAVDSYKARLVDEVSSAVAKCPKSLFIFDEVEKMPAGLFDSIVSLLNNHSGTKLNFRQSVFIFLSNVAGPEIAHVLKKKLDNGTWRFNTKMNDFEQTLELVSYNLDGGMYRSELIEAHVVDHFIPFLPLEVRHVERCVIEEYRKLFQTDIDEATLKAIVEEAVTFDETGIFSNSGCKRINKKVESFHYNKLRTTEKYEL